MIKKINTSILIFFLVMSCREYDQLKQNVNLRNSMISAISKQSFFIKCETGISLLRFEFDEGGKLVRFSLSDNSSKQIRLKFEKIDLSEIRHSGDANRSCVFIMPFIYNFQSGCTDNLDSVLNVSSPITNTLSNDLFNFSNANNFSNHQYILLEPLTESSLE
jgi:hypothetical protein